MVGGLGGGEGQIWWGGVGGGAEGQIWRGGGGVSADLATLH